MDSDTTVESGIIGVLLAFVQLVAALFRRHRQDFFGHCFLRPQDRPSTTSSSTSSTTSVPAAPTTTTTTTWQQRLARELADQSFDTFDHCYARLTRAFEAGKSAASKLSGQVRTVSATPSLASICKGLSQPSPKWYIVLRGAQRDIASLHRAWSSAASVVGSPIHNHSVFHSFHYRAEVEAYIRGSGRLHLLPLVQ